MKKVLLASAILAASVANTGAQAADPSWKYAELSYGMGTFSGAAYTGYGVAATYELVPNIYGKLSYFSMDGALGAFNTTEVSLGYRINIGTGTDAYIQVDHAKFGGALAGGPGDTTGSIGVRSMVTNEVEVGASMTSSPPDPKYRLHASYYFTPTMAAGLGYFTTKSADMTFVNFRMNF